MAEKASDPVVDPPLSPTDAAPQHGPRPLPLFLDMLRSETAASSERREAALQGLRAYQVAPRTPRPPAMPVRHRAGRACLRDYGGSGRPVVLVPSLINPPHILDLTPETSLLRWLAAQGVHVHLLDWDDPSPADRDMNLADYVERILLPLLDRLSDPPVLVGYCLGGTLALAAACLTQVAGLALIAAPWRFSGFGDAARAEIAALWQTARPSCKTLGLVPMEVLQSGFWKLDPAKTIAKYEAFARLDPTSEQARLFVAMEDWANAGAPLPYAAGRDLFERFIADDAPGRGEWAIGGQAISPERLSCQAVDFVSRNDRIVPAASAAGLADRHLLGAGHVGMIVGSRARAQLWQPLADWIAALPATR